MDAIKVCDLFDLTHTRAAKTLAACEYPWEALSKIGETVLAIGQGLDLSDYDHPAENVWIAKTATVAATASIAGPCVIGEKTEVRPGAFIRGNVLVGDGAVVGNSCELKNCILFDEVQTPHYNYVGDSVLGYKAHMGAGAVTKWLFARERRIERAPNVRNIEEYIARVEEMIERKRALIGGGEL